VKRFGRSEQGTRGDILWSVFEAEDEGDFRGGRLLASFATREDALAFVALPDLQAAAGDALATLVALAAWIAPNGRPWSEAPSVMLSARLLRDAIAKTEGRAPLPTHPAPERAQ